MSVNDILVHKIPHVRDAEERLRYELDGFESRFGRIQFIRMGPCDDFGQMTALLRYKNPNVHSSVVDHFNWIGIPNTEICFEINPQPTEPTVVQEALEYEVERLNRELKDLTYESEDIRIELKDTRYQSKLLKNKLAENQDLIHQILYHQQSAFEEAGNGRGFRQLRSQNEGVSSF